MNQRVSSRHEGDLGGQLLPFGDANQVGVTILVPAETAHMPSVQHTAWMLLNLLARLDGVVHRVGICCPPGVALCGRVIPLAPRDLDLATALAVGGKAIGVTPVDPDVRLERTISVGPARTAGQVDLYALGGGWCGGMATAPDAANQLDLRSALPFGPYLAACLAAGEVFKGARMRPGTCVSPPAAYYSAWSHVASSSPIPGGCSRVEVGLDVALAGVGAVGSATTHALWACPGASGNTALIDNDPKGLETSNLNRYALFGQDSVGRAKATEAARIASDAEMRWMPQDAAIESMRLTSSRVASAVDRNSARAAIQFQYPARLFSASTLDLRAELLRCGPPGVGACLRCFNEPEKIAPDAELRQRLKAAPESELFDLAASVGLTLNEAKEWVETGRCGFAGERLLGLMRGETRGGAFAVGFVSVMAGTLLAAELIKDQLSLAAPLSESQQRATFQFFSPLARSNRASSYLRDPRCPMCGPETPACRIWTGRYRGASEPNHFGKCVVSQVASVWEISLPVIGEPLASFS
jgi:molybdopterin/thiamine biosynthesis adenylyltransferase